MQNLGFEWPSELECDLMPERGENELCLDFNLPKRIINTHITPDIDEELLKPPENSLISTQNEFEDGQCCNKCQLPSFVKVNDEEAEIFEVTQCAQTCVSSFFRPKNENRPVGDREFIETWIMAWVISCGVVSVLTCATFAIQPVAVDYPERNMFILYESYTIVYSLYKTRKKV